VRHYSFALACCTALAISAATAQETAPAPPAATPGPPVPRPVPVVEYDSGVRMEMAQPWTKQGKDGTSWVVNGAEANGKLVIRFPFAIEPAPASLDELYERDLKAMQKDKTWKREKKEIAADAPALAAPEAFKTRQLSVVSIVKGARRMSRHLYIATSEGKFLALDCSQPESAMAVDDPCAKVASSLTVIPEPGLSLARDRQRAADFDTPCAIVNQEIERFRAANPDKPLKEMYRFAVASGFITTAAMQKTGMAAMVALTTAMPDIVKHTEATCREQPAMKFIDALGEGTKQGLPSNKG
jgi:hypothetical protein